RIQLIAQIAVLLPEGVVVIEERRHRALQVVVPLGLEGGQAGLVAAATTAATGRATVATTVVIEQCEPPPAWIPPHNHSLPRSTGCSDARNIPDDRHGARL